MADDYYDCAPEEGTERFDPDEAAEQDISLEEWIEGEVRD